MQVYHPNIDEDGNIYIDILEEDQWNPVQTIESLLLSICSLLDDPNPVDPLNPSCFLFKTNREEFNKMAKEWTKKYASEWTFESLAPKECICWKLLNAIGILNGFPFFLLTIISDIVPYVPCCRLDPNSYTGKKFRAQNPSKWYVYYLRKNKVLSYVSYYLLNWF